VIFSAPFGYNRTTLFIQKGTPVMGDNDIPTETIAETENYIAWTSDEPDGERGYHLELGTVTLHFFREEWDELLELIEEAANQTK
jgi:hypothetical protein